MVTDSAKKTITRNALLLTRYLEDRLLDSTYVQAQVVFFGADIFANILGFDKEMMEMVTADIDRWADRNRRPSITCMMRPNPLEAGEFQWYDVVTQFNRRNTMAIQRFTCQMTRKGKSNIYTVEAMPGTADIVGLTGSIDLDLPLHDSTTGYERKLLLDEHYKYFWESI